MRLAMIATVSCLSVTFGAAPPPPARTDLYGDTLPTGATARLGTMRFRDTGPVLCVAFSHDRKLVASSGKDPNRVVLWDRATEERLASFTPPDTVTRLQFAPDDRVLYLLVREHEWRLYRWDVRRRGKPTRARTLPGFWRTEIGSSGREVFQADADYLFALDPATGKVKAKAVAPAGELGRAALVGGNLVVPVFAGGMVRMTDAVAEKVLWSARAALPEWPAPELLTPLLTFSPSFSADGTVVAIGDVGKAVTVYRTLTGKKLAAAALIGPDRPYGFALSPDGRTLAVAGVGEVHLIDVRNGREKARVTGHGSRAADVFFSPDSRVFATAGPDAAPALLMWDTDSGEPVNAIRGHDSPPNSVVISPDGRTALTASHVRGENRVIAWDLPTGRPRPETVRMPSDGGGVSAVALSPDGTTAAAGTAKQGVRLWDVRSGRVLTDLKAYGDNVIDLAFSPDGSTLAALYAYTDRFGNGKGRLRLWRTRTGGLHREIDLAHEPWQTAFSPDGRVVYAAGEASHAFEVASGTALPAASPYHASARGPGLSPDGRLKAVTSGLTLRLVETATGRALGDLPALNALEVAFTPDGRRIVAAGPAGLTAIHLPTTTAEAIGRERDLEVVRLTPDGRRAVTAGSHRPDALVWDFPASPVPNRVGKKPAAEQVQKWWDDLRDAEPGIAWRAVWSLADSPSAAVPFLAKRLRVSMESVDGPSGRWRESRAVAALEHTGTPEARRVLERLASGPAAANLTAEAKAALTRMDVRRR